MRVASPNEQRVISREYHNFYNSVVVGAIYEFPDPDFDVGSSRSFHGALRLCISKYPTLTHVVREQQSDAAYFELVQTINLEDHIHIVGEGEAIPQLHKDDGDHGTRKIEELLPSLLNDPWPSSIPPWKITILSLETSGRDDGEKIRCFIAFSFSHALGDGMGAYSFHRTFRDGLTENIGKEDCIVLATPIADFPAPFDTPKTLPISWGFLLRPLIAVLLPSFLAEFLGLRPNTSNVHSGTWNGSRMFRDPGPHRTSLRLVKIEASTAKALLQVARKNGAKLTATMNQSISRALSKALSPSSATNFVSGTAVNMRRAVGKANEEMGFFVNACYHSHDRQNWAELWTDETWAVARSLTEKLAETAVTLSDQPTGLLRYVPSINKWTLSKIGQERDTSFDVSNIGAFDPGVSRASSGNQCGITDMIFTHSAGVTSGPLTISAASAKGSSLMIVIAWQPGALGIPREIEAAFVDDLSAFVKEDLESVARM
ncbi:Alcohol acetyltransferase [Pestalotiopsis sp. IQ-011]